MRRSKTSLLKLTIEPLNELDSRDKAHLTGSLSNNDGDG